MRRGVPIFVILTLSLIILIPTNFLRKNISPQIPLQDLQGLSKLLSPFIQWGRGSEILQNLADQFKDPSIFILAGITRGEEGNIQGALALLEKAENLLPVDPLPSLLHQLYDPKRKPNKETSSLIEQEIKTRLRGWFRDKPLARLYRLGGNLIEAERLEARISSYNRAILMRVLILLTFWLLAFLGGTFLLIRYIATRSKGVPAPPPPSFLSWGWALAFIFIFVIISSAISSIPIFILSLPIEASTFWRSLFPLFLLLGELIGAVVVLYIISKRLSKWGISLRDWVVRTNFRGSLRWGIGGWLTAFPLVLVAFLISYLLNADAIKSQQDVSLLFLSSSLWGKLVMACLAILVAPPIEEFLFRGLLYSSLRQELGVYLSITLSAFFFASIHHDVSRLLPLMALGSLFAFLYEKQGSLLPSITAHALWNTHTIVALSILFG